MADEAKVLVPQLLAELRGHSHASGDQVADILAAIVDSYEARLASHVDSYEARLAAHEARSQSQQQQIEALQASAQKNHGDIVGLVEQTNSRMKENMVRINEKVRKLKDGSGSRLDRQRTATRSSGRRPDLSLSSEGFRAASKEFGVRDSADSVATSGMDFDGTPASAMFPIAAEDEQDVEEGNEPDVCDGEVTFDIDDPESPDPKPKATGASQPQPQLGDERGLRTGATLPMEGLSRSSLSRSGTNMMSGFSFDTYNGYDDETGDHPPGCGHLTVVTGQMLDRGDMYRSNPSVWDTMFFIGMPAIGTSCSVLVGVIWVLNVLLQVSFIYIVEEVLQQPAVDSSVLDGLLRFRLGTAHSADFADKVSQRSMAAQVCQKENKLHMAGGQQNLYADLEKFDSSRAWLAELLVMLIQFLWAATVLRDINNTYTIFRGVKGVLRSRKSTRLYLADLQDSDDEDEIQSTKPSDPATPAIPRDSKSNTSAGALLKTSRTLLRSLIEQDNDGQAEESQANLVSLMKVVRWTRIWYVRFYGIICFVCIPKLILACVLYWVGAKWLAGTISLTELILNGVALAFVLDFDEVLFDIFVPRRCKILVGNLEPLPLSRGAKVTGTMSVINSVVKLGGCSILLIGIYMFMEPFFWQLRQAQAIMCNGDQNFIYTVNPATGLVHVAKTSGSADEWSETEYVVAQLAKPTLWDHDYWGEYSNDRMFDAVVSPTSLAVPTPGADSDAFKHILQMNVWSVSDAAAALPCEDLAESLNRAAAVRELRQLVGRDNVNSCADVQTELCSRMDMFQLRALCPKHCGCEEPLGGKVGFFGTPNFGCPTQCATFRAARNEIEFRWELAAADPTVPYDGTCRQWDREDFTFAGGCSSSESTFDHWHSGCSFYEGYHNPKCDGERDDSDFTAVDMCCECANRPAAQKNTTDPIPNGKRENVPSSADCWQDFTEDCWHMPSKKLAWLLYVRGLFEHLLSQTGFEDSVRKVVNDDYAGLKHNATSFPEGLDVETIVSYITDGTDGMARKLAVEDTWEIAPGVAHPRGMTGCDFLASYEITALLNMDLCDAAEGTSIKFFCPNSCGCAKGNSLSECPASCVLTDCTSSSCKHAHPWYSLTDWRGDVIALDSTCTNTAVVNATDKNGRSCPVRDADGQWPVNGTQREDICGNPAWDDEDFSADYQCCICHGGSTFSACHDQNVGDARDANGKNCYELLWDTILSGNANLTNCTADDEDFTAQDMCCECGGGSEAAEADFTLRVHHIDYDGLTPAQKIALMGSLKENIVHVVHSTGYSPSTTAEDVEVELKQGSVIVLARVTFPSITPSIFTRETGVSKQIQKIMLTDEFEANVTSDIRRIDGLGAYGNLTMSLTYFSSGGVVPGAPLKQWRDGCNGSAADGCDCSVAQDNKFRDCSWYWKDPWMCKHAHLYNDEDFSSETMCCACEGVEVLAPTPAPTPDASCEDTQLEGAVNQWGMNCDVFTQYPNYCGAAYDDEDFSRELDCCACGGGARGCEDTAPAGAVNTWGMNCAVFAQHDNYCGADYDDEDFSRCDMCCACKDKPGCQAGPACPDLAPIPSVDCPADPQSLAKCTDLSAIAAGELCEDDGECGASNDVNNCGYYDVYRVRA